MVGRSTSIVSILPSGRNSRLFWSAMVHQALHQRRCFVDFDHAALGHSQMRVIVEKCPDRDPCCLPPPTDFSSEQETPPLSGVSFVFLVEMGEGRTPRPGHRVHGAVQLQSNSTAAHPTTLTSPPYPATHAAL
jgi:hypothetical protein